MNPFSSPDTVYLVIGFIVPGLIIIFVRAQFITGRTIKHGDALLSYLTVSAIYYAAILPAILYISSVESIWRLYAVWSLAIFVLPTILGILLGVSVQREWFRRVLRYFSLNPVHVMPTAWDWKFSSMQNQWILATLKDGTKFAGFCGNDSFFSSDPGERDVYIQWVYDIDDNNNWVCPGHKSVLIASGEIKTVEFWPYTEGDVR